MKSSATMISQFEFRLLIASFASMSKMLAVQPSLCDSIGKKKKLGPILSVTNPTATHLMRRACILD